MGLPFMTSILREEGVGPKADDSTDRLRECYGQGVQNHEKFVDVINGSTFCTFSRHDPASRIPPPQSAPKRLEESDGVAKILALLG